MLYAVLMAIRLVPFYGPDGHMVEINPQEVVLIREPRKIDSVVSKDVHCLIFLADGKFAAVREDCATVRQRLLQAEGAQ